ncbi:MAG: ATP-binding protein [Candidatus Micrarchaeota archaeon]
MRKFVRRANEAGRIDFKFGGVKPTLNKLGLMQDGKVLRAADALFSRRNPIKVQAAVFAGKDRLTFLDIRQFEGNLFNLLERAEDYIKERMNWRVEFGRLEREEIPEVPLKAIREAIVNSLCHRDYSAPEANQVAFYKDRIEIYSPGAFPEGFAPSDFIRGHCKSILRNPLIADALFRTRDIEKWGSGLKRIFDECRANGVRIDFQKLKTGFQVVFYRRDINTEPFEEDAQKGTQKSAQKIIEIIKKNNNITRDGIAGLLGISGSAVKKHLRNLKKKGLLQRIGPDKGGYWRITKRRGSK